MPINKFVTRKTYKTRLWCTDVRSLLRLHLTFFSQFFSVSDYCFQGPLCIVSNSSHVAQTAKPSHSKPLTLSSHKAEDFKLINMLIKSDSIPLIQLKFVCMSVESPNLCLSFRGVS